MKRLIVVASVIGSFVLTFTTFAQYAEPPYYDSVTVAFRKRCAEEGFESCLTFLLKDQDKHTQAEVFQRLTESEKDQIDAFLKAKAEAAKLEAEARQKAAEMKQRQAEARQQAIRHDERMLALQRQQRSLDNLLRKIRDFRAQQRQKKYKIKRDGSGGLIAVPRYP